MAIFKAFYILIVQLTTISSLRINHSSITLFTPSNKTKTVSLHNPQNPNITETYIECKRAHPPLRPYTPRSCFPLISSLCKELNTTPLSLIPRDFWVWTDLLPFPNCAVAYWIPGHATPEMIPTTLDDCVNGIFGRMVELCAGRPVSNVGSVNVDAVPDTFGPGTEREAGFPSFLVASEKLGSFHRD